MNRDLAITLPARNPTASDMPYFSVITCTLNCEKYLQETIESVERQEFRSFEHIFVDAFSDDATVSLIAAYKSRCPDQVHFHQLKPDGISNAMNFGISLARGEVILHLHGDDHLASSKVFGLVRGYFEVTQASIVAGNCLLKGQDRVRYAWPRNRIKRMFFKICLRPLMFYTNLIPHAATYVKRAVFNKHGNFNERYKVVMDYDFWFRVLRCEQFYVAEEVFSIYRFHPQTVSTTQMALGLVEIDEIRERYKNDYAMAYWIFSILLRPLLRLRRLFKSRALGQCPT